MEIWETIRNLSKYEVSTYGNVRNKDTKKNLKCCLNGGYLSVCLQTDEGKKKTYMVHRLVALQFIPNPENKYTVNHKDHNKSNNNINNLEWATIKEQNRHKRKVSREVQRLIGSRKVWRINKDTGEKIELYETMTDAAKWLFDNNLTRIKEFNNGNNIRSKICTVCRKRRKTAYGFKWEYDDSSDNIYVDEVWKDIPPELINGKEHYKISSYGRIKNRTGRISEGSKKHLSGYVLLSVCSKLYRAHRLVAKVFIPNPNNKPQVNHINGNKQNNKVSNLEWNTSQENVQHAHDIGLHKKTKK